MIVVDDPQQPQSPGERSPLKSPAVTTREGLPQPPQAPPPPYVSRSYEPSQSYSVPHPGPGNLPPPVTVLVVRRNTALGRFLRALGVALIVLFLWGMFVDSLQILIGRSRRSGHYTYEEEIQIPDGIEWIVRDWYRPASTTLAPTPTCSCSHNTVLPVETGRNLPIECPPAVSQTEVQFSITIPTSAPS